MFLLSAIVDGQDLEAAITQAKTAHKNHQLAYQWFKKGALKDYVPEETQLQREDSYSVHQNFQKPRTNLAVNAAGELGWDRYRLVIDLSAICASDHSSAVVSWWVYFPPFHL